MCVVSVGLDNLKGGERMANSVTLINGSDIIQVVCVEGATVADVLDAAGICSEGYQIKIGNEKVTVGASVSGGDVVLLVPNVVAG